MIKLKLYPTAWIAGLVLVASVALKSLWLISSSNSVPQREIVESTEPLDSNLSDLPMGAVTISESESQVVSQAESQSPTRSSSPSPSPSLNPIQLNTPGSVRVGNQTQHPVRVVLKRRSASGSSAQPIHWDFAPQEGSVKGLTLALPDEGLTLVPGDVLVVFAQDGSRRYWGPYIVDETALPEWSKTDQAWQLTVQP
ncbi:MAG: hypothetical protein ACRC8A_11525 [Microcoleaceae cyanobacterium]